MKIVQILKDGSMNELNEKSVTFKNCGKVFLDKSKSQGNNDLKELYQWNYEDSIIHCYGWYDGESGFENKHEMIPGGKSKFLEEDSSVQLLFGDIFLIKSLNKKITSFDVSDYSEFYNLMFGGFDECDDDIESEEINTESEDDDYKPDSDDQDDIEEYDDIIIGCEETYELKEDTTEY
jgi:hypothetical protein